jgi:TfoX/Sxy family transcriptional regulator of competence genes
MPYDEAIAERIRALVPEAAEKKMFGGLAFLVKGNMAVAASGRGGLLVRVDPEESDELIATTSAELMEMGGRSMKGWLRVPVGDDFDEWVERGVAYAHTLPPK